MKKILFLSLFFILACKPTQKTVIPAWAPYDETEELAKNATNASTRMQYKLIQSKILDKNTIWENIAQQIGAFSEDDYQRLKPLILEQNIPTIQSHIKSGSLSYETLTQWYLYRIVKYENDKDKMLNAIVAINPEAVNEARKRDKNKSNHDHPIYGIPILVKDNTNVKGMPTTAGTHLLRNNTAADAFIITQIKDKGAIVLGKTNLSEWANFLFLTGPNGYSAVGGQTLNPYGRKIFDTGGSSSGSGAAVAANYAAAAVGTETSGSILSPSWQNSIIGLKPTTGLLSRTGIIPISSTLDTPGPMTKNVTDSGILLSAMSGEDNNDPATKNNPKNIKYLDDLKSGTLQGLRFGAIKNFLGDSIYKQSINTIIKLGGIVVEYDPEPMNFDGFGTILSADMKVDLPNYLNKYASNELTIRSIADIIAYNKNDSILKIPYGQGRFEQMLAENTTEAELLQIKAKIKKEGVNFFEKPMVKYQLDAILSINNNNAGHAAAANYPCLTIPMGYKTTGEPWGLTFIARPYHEDSLLKMGFAFEKATKIRKLPQDYK
ncbi:amidase [Flavobacterium sp. GSP27]|uniref:amidase family protein n=1 Tax=unclassified Flavobacterium TaxID=196869 RepID=UPI000F823A6E|nr:MULTISPECIES: amidase family protein [unclassified Flavobacterium]RTY76235.1 amidase [Flavobacterium sp. LS1R10]RTY87949.1 amidase [Flavobacterium sp. GSN2]RTZ10253.1 amidase [Flavobacterium sp. GSP27]